MAEAHRPRKRFGQHFLRDSRVLQQIAALINVKATDHVLEIGPGQGVLTDLLAPIAGRLDAVELDRDLIQHLTERYRDLPQVHIHQGDALVFPLRELAPAGQKMRVLGNLPYNISTPLLFRLFDLLDVIQDMHFLLQKEVVDRLCAQPGSASYGRLSVMAQYYCQNVSLLEVPPQAFNPPPKVDSALVRLLPRPQAPVTVSDVAQFSAFVAQAFSARRKTLRNVLKAYLSAADFESVAVDPGRRAETLSLDEFAKLFTLFTQKDMRQS